LLYPDKVQRALEKELSRFREWERTHTREVELYARGLDCLQEMTAAEVHTLIEDKSSPGALPSEEHGSPLVLPFPERWSCHEEARAWAFQRIQGITTLAVDGSQLLPAKDYSYGLAAIQVAWFENPHRGEARDYVKDARFEIMSPDSMLEGEDGGSPISMDVNSRRFGAEVEEIVRHMRGWGRQDPPPVAFFDGTLVASFAAPLPEKTRMKYVRSILALLAASEEHRVPVVGFIDTSYAKDLCTLLSHVVETPRPVQVNDGHLLRGRMRWGDRTRAFVCARDHILGYYRDEGAGQDYQREVAFLYLQTTSDGPPARIDLPRWIVREGLVDYVADVIRCEVIAGTGYPYCFEAVDAAAVLSMADREAFYGQVQAFCERNGMRLRLAPKAASKRRRRV
jgi:hypothetical protein